MHLNHFLDLYLSAILNHYGNIGSPILNHVEAGLDHHVATVDLGHAPVRRRLDGDRLRGVGRKLESVAAGNQLSLVD